jgi:putative flippase GtrA
VGKSGRRSPWTVVRYLTVGVLNTCVGLATIYLGMYMFRLGNVTANVIGYALGIAFSFVLNKRWTFASTGKSAPQLMRFLLVTATAYVTNLVTVMVLINGFETNQYLAQALGIGPYTTIGYLGSRFFVFRDSAS